LQTLKTHYNTSISNTHANFLSTYIYFSSHASTYETGISFAFEHDHRSEYHPPPTTKPVNTAKHTKLKQTYRILPYVCCKTKQTNLMCNITNY